MIEFIWDDGGIQRALHKLQHAGHSLHTPLNVIGLRLVESTKQRFETSTAPDGTRWAKNSNVTIANFVHSVGGTKSKDGKLLSAKGGKRWDSKKPLIGKTGALMDQISYSVSGGELLVYSTMQYAAMQQFGGTKAEFKQLWGDIPARPYLGLSGEDELMIQHVLDNYLKNAF